MHNRRLKTTLSLAFLATVGPAQALPNYNSQSHLTLIPPRPAVTLSASGRLSENWSVSLSAPVLFNGEQIIPTVGLHSSKTFQIGHLFAPHTPLESLNLGLAFSAYAPLNFSEAYLGGSMGLGHGCGVGPFYFNYGLRYAPLFRISQQSQFWNGLLFNGGIHLPTGPLRTVLAFQMGQYYPLDGGNPLWVFEPYIGSGINF